MNSLRQKWELRHIDEVEPLPYLVEMLCKLYQSRMPEEMEAYLWSSGKLLECVCGKRAWGKRKYQTTMSEATEKVTGELIVTVSDEAFALLLFENYIEKWIQRYDEEIAGVETKKRITGKYTRSSIGYNEYVGWSEDGVIRFNELCNIVKDDRNSRNAKEVEEEILAGCGDRNMENNLREMMIKA